MIKEEQNPVGPVLTAAESRRRVLHNMCSSLLYNLSVILFGLLLPRLYLTSFGSELNGLDSTIKQIFSCLTLLEAGVGLASQQAYYLPVAVGDGKAINGIFSATHHYYRRTGIVYLLVTVVFALLYPLCINTVLSYGTVSLIVVAHHGVRAVQVPQGLVDGDALSFQSLLEDGSLAGIDRAGAGAAVHQVHRAVAEQADLSAAGQRQSIVLVLQQSCALGLDRRAQFGLVSLALLIGSKALLEVFGIAGILAVDDLIGRCIQSDVDGGSVLVCDDVAHDGSDGQDRRQAGENRPQPYFRFGVFHGFSSFFL